MFTDIDSTYHQEKPFFEKTTANSGEGFLFQDTSSSLIKSEEDPFEAFFQTNSPQLLDSDDDGNENIEEDDNNEQVQASSEDKTTNFYKKIFFIKKDYAIRQKQAMKKKIERVKTLLGGKTNRDYLVFEDSMKPKKIKSSKAEMKEINLIKNRIAAQKSRDNHKSKMEYLESRNNFLTSENNTLKEEIKKKEKDINYLIDKATECDTCRKYLNINSEIGIEPNRIYKNLGGAISLIGMFCFIGLLMIFGYGASSNNNSGLFNYPMRHLSTVDMPYFNNKTNSKFETVIHDKYIENDVLDYIVKNHPKREHIVKLLQTHHPVNKNDSKENIAKTNVLREKFVIDLFNKLRVANSLQEIQSKSKGTKKTASLPLSPSTTLMTYKKPTCYNPDQFPYTKKRNRLSLKETSVNPFQMRRFNEIAMMTKNQKQNEKQAHVYMPDYTSPTSETIKNEDSKTKKKSLDIQLLFDTKEKQQTIQSQTQFMMRNNTRDHNNDSLYKSGCKLFSISKLS